MTALEVSAFEVESSDDCSPVEVTAEDTLEAANGIVHSPEIVLTRKASVSEAAEASNEGFNAPFYLKWFEYPFHMKDPVTGMKLPEAAGWAMDAAARGPLTQFGGYMGSAILQMATAEATANGTTTIAFGLQPSSLFTLSSSVIGVVAAILLPVFGAIVDHTRHRKLVGVVSGFLTILLTGMQIGISLERNNWLYILVLDGLQSFILLVHATACFAYLPDLTLDHEILPKYTAHFITRQFGFQLTYTSFVIITSVARGIDERLEASVQTARDSAGLALGYGMLFIGYSWTFLFRPRPALSQVPEGSNLLTTGFKQVATTTRKIWGQYRALRWFLFSLLWSPEAGAGVVLSIAVTFLTFVVGFSTLDIAKMAIIVMAGNLPGAFVSTRMCKWVNPLNSYRLGMICLAISMGLAAAFVSGPDHRARVFGLSVLWGFTMGWSYASQRVLFVTLIPKGQETEMMGLFFFTGQIIGWLPPLLVTILNEEGYNRRWSLALIGFFCIFAIICTLPMGGYREATELMARESEKKLDQVIAKTSEHMSKRKSKAVDLSISSTAGGAEEGEADARKNSST